MINTLDHLAYILRVEEKEFDHIIQNIDQYYYEKSKIRMKDNTPILDEKGNPKKRVFDSSIKRLRIVQDRILKDIFSKLELPEYTYGGVKGRDNVKNAKKHQGKKFKFTTDLKDYFPSINNQRVFKMFRSYNFSPSVSHILTQLTTYKGRLPQGVPTSSAIANLVFIKTGKKLQAFAEKNKITFTSFVDDLSFSSPISFKDIIGTILKLIKSDGFRISHNKTGYGTKKVITGLIPKQNNLTLPDSFKLKLKNTEGKTEVQIIGEKLYAEKVKKANS